MYLKDYGPYVETLPNGTKCYYLHGLLHRVNGPAIEYANGDKFYYLYGQLHREDGPAMEYSSGDKYYYLFNKIIEVSYFKKQILLLNIMSKK